MKSAANLVPFAHGKEAADFGHALVEKMEQQAATLREQVIPSQNISNLPHGHGWTFQQERKDGFAPKTGEFREEKAELAVGYDRVMMGDSTLLDEFITSMAQRFHEKLMEGLIGEMNETSTREGRTDLVPKGGSLAYGILQGLGKVHASVDEDGQVCFPQLWMSPEMEERLGLEMALHRKNIERRAADTRSKAEKEARAREAQRLAKFDS